MTHPTKRATGDSYTITYRIMTNAANEDQERTFEVLATPQEIEQLATQGYLVRERLFSGDLLERLRIAVDEVELAERGAENISRSSRFGGWFPRHLMDKHPAFHELIHFAPTLSIARAVLGPFVRIRNLGGRVSYPGEPNQETHWHIHRRTIPDPVPPFFSFPHTIDCLIYLDELNEANGLLAFVPGSHLRIHEPLPADHYGDLPGQQLLRAPAGTCLIIHSNLWHRALPTRPDGNRRRLLILGYSATWMRESPYGTKPENGLLEKVRQNADRETQELLGVGGYQ